MLKFLVFVLFALGITHTAAAQNNGPFQLPPGSFGVATFGQRQALPSGTMEEARRLGLFEETVDIRSGWIDRVAKVTGRLDIMTAAKDADGNPLSIACTGTAITDRLILTNAHCVPRSGRKRAISVLFLPNYRDARQRAAVTVHPVSLSPVERGDEDTMDYAIFQLERPLPDYQPLGLAVRDPGAGEPLVIVGHPNGQPLHLSRGRCRSDHEVPMDKSDVVHGCATLPGSSGSLVFSSEGQVVGLHFFGGELLSGRQVNRAIRMEKLLHASQTLCELYTSTGDQRGSNPSLFKATSNSEKHPCTFNSTNVATGAPERRLDVTMPEELMRKKESCEAGNVKDCLSLAQSLDGGHIIAEDKFKALKYYDIACNIGSLQGCYRLALSYDNGWGTNVDHNKASHLYTDLCDNGHVGACHDLGSNYILGKGVERNQQKGEALIKYACENGKIRFCPGK